MKKWELVLVAPVVIGATLILVSVVLNLTWQVAGHIQQRYKINAAKRWRVLLCVGLLPVVAVGFLLFVLVLDFLFTFLPQ